MVPGPYLSIDVLYFPRVEDKNTRGVPRLKNTDETTSVFFRKDMVVRKSYS